MLICIHNEIVFYTLLEVITYGLIKLGPRRCLVVQFLFSLHARLSHPIREDLLWRCWTDVFNFLLTFCVFTKQGKEYWWHSTCTEERFWYCVWPVKLLCSSDGCPCSWGRSFKHAGGTISPTPLPLIMRDYGENRSRDLLWHTSHNIVHILLSNIFFFSLYDFECKCSRWVE